MTRLLVEGDRQLSRRFVGNSKAEVDPLSRGAVMCFHLPHSVHGRRTLEPHLFGLFILEYIFDLALGEHRL